MTVIKAVYLQCEICGEPSSYDSTPPESTVEQARAAARAEGWRRDKLGRDVCPEHPKLKGARR